MAEQTAVKQTESYEQDLTEEEIQMQMEQKLQLFGSGLQKKFDDQVGLKEEIEQRWLEDMRHYNGRYDRDTEAKMNAKDDNPNASRVFVNLTRAKTNIAESKWSDLVLPTDDRNWGLKPTPVPDVVEGLTDESPLQLADGSTAVDPETQQPHRVKDMMEQIVEQAKKKASRMQDEIDDQLTEASFNPVCRDIIHDACTLGTGIIKGPMVEKRAKRAWIKNDQGQWMLDFREENKPTAARVDPWNFFPDMSATCWDDVEFVFERHLLTKKQVRKLGDQPGYMKSQLRKVLDSAPNAMQSKLTYLNELRAINGITQIQGDNRYEVIEYHGPVDKEILVQCGCDVDETDPLEEYEGRVWLCLGMVLKVALNHLDSNELPYNVLNWEKDETSVFGFGVPYRMRTPQRVMNASWRMVLDNAGLSTGPQIVINRELVEPADGKWELRPRKLWWMKTKDPKFRAEYAFQTFDIPSSQQELTAIFEMAHRLADEETNIPQMQLGNIQGDTQQPAMLKTLGGTALWMASNNIMMRKAVKNFDDDIIEPFITRFYDWNMQFSEKEEIKGDFSTDARGTSVLLVREMQARNIMELVTAALSLPGGAAELNTRGVLKNMAKSMQIGEDEVFRSDAQAENAAKEPPPPDPEMQKLQIQREIAQMTMQQKAMEVEGDHQKAVMMREVELTKLAVQENVDLNKIRADNDIKQYVQDWNMTKFYTELKLKMDQGADSNIGLV